jgi:hypothetical protein
VSAATGKGGTYFRFYSGTPGRSPDHVSYITRESAVRDRDRAVLAYNLPDAVRDARGYDELRDNLVAHAQVREEQEMKRHRGPHEARTHYRVRASFEREVSSERALAMAKEWLDGELPKARGFAVVHRDTEHVHVHIWIDARQTDGKKIQLPREKYRSLDSRWNQLYSAEMKRDPQEHERKKAQTREAKRQGWERRERPEYPPRVRAAAEELAKKWERRDLGVQGARNPADRPDNSFLPYVRAVAGADFKEAGNWDELDRRLARHGLRVQARGNGMVVTDGKQVVTASSVDRTTGTSRGDLEKRFGEKLADHRRKPPEHERTPTARPELVRDLRELERRRWTREDHVRAQHIVAAERARADSMRWARERAQTTGERFEQGLAPVYRDPKKARAEFEQAARDLGADRAAQLLRDQPERFGELRTVEQRRLLGVIRTQDETVARARVPHAAELGREAGKAAAAAPGERELGWAERRLGYAERRERWLGRELNRDATLIRARVALAMQKVLPRELDELRRWVSAPQLQAATKLRQQMEKLAPQHVRELASWVRAPHTAIPAKAVQAFRGLLQDQGRERGMD